MGNVGSLVVLSLFIVAPCAIAAWVGTRVRRSLIAFVLAWILTPIVSVIVTLVLWPVLRAMIPSNNDGTGAIMIPFFGIVTGLVAGIVAAMIVGRRRDRANEPSLEPPAPHVPPSDTNVGRPGE